MADAHSADDRHAQFLLVHSLRSLALTMGATELGEAATVLEWAYLAHDHAACDAMLPGLLAQHSLVLAGPASLEGTPGLLES